jgi:hypothetical protein
MLTIAASDTIAGVAATGASEVTCTLFLMELNTGTGAETYKKDQQQLADSVATIYTATADGPTFVRAIHVVNTDTGAASTFQLFAGGTAQANAITPIFTLVAGGFAVYEDGLGWQFFDTSGQVLMGTGYTSINIQSFVTPGAATYTPTPGMKHCIAIVTGAGAGGGGSDSAGGSGDVAAAGGGGAGGTAIGFFTAAQVGASKPLNIGAAGTGGVAANGTDGVAGGNSTWNTTDLVGTGGGLGVGTGAVAIDNDFNNGGAGGTPTGGTINIDGGGGDNGVAVSGDGTIDIIFARGGCGGSSFWGGGGRAPATASNTLTNAVNTAGGAGLVYGSGGAGAVTTASITGAAGGDGMSGIIMVIEYI